VRVSVEWVGAQERLGQGTHSKGAQRGLRLWRKEEKCPHPPSREIVVREAHGDGSLTHGTVTEDDDLVLWRRSTQIRSIQINKLCPRAGTAYSQVERGYF